jgi:hypothetical protein
MSNVLYRAASPRSGEGVPHHRGALPPSIEMRTHYSRMAEHYNSRAEGEELGTLACGH